MPEHGLTAEQLQIIREVLAPHAGVIQQVGLFGSRAKGTARPNSDIDLVLYGPLSEAIVDRVWTLFAESCLAVTVDIVAYDLIEAPALKSHIDAVMQPLFAQDGLQLAQKRFEAQACAHRHITPPCES